MTIFFTIITAIAAIMVILRTCEKRAWNGGYCPKCDGEWESFGMDSSGATGYECPCDNVIWISGSYPMRRKA